MVVLRPEASPWVDRRRERKAKGDVTMSLGKRAKVIGMLSAVLLVVAAAGIGCGGGDSSGDSNGGGDSGKGSSAKQASGPDEYASQVCDALGKYADDIQALSDSQTDMEDPTAMQDFIGQMVPVFEGISKDLDKINPPSEVEEWHNGVVSGMSNAVELFSKMGDALDKPLDEAMAEITDLSSEMSDMDNPFGSMTDLPTEYQQAFEDNADCQDLQNLDFFQ